MSMVVGIEKTTHGKHLVELKRELNRAVGYK